ncbi:MAG TPA: hypothetical protein VIX90_12440 [Edaphobacter sp.]
MIPLGYQLLVGNESGKETAAGVLQTATAIAKIAGNSLVAIYLLPQADQAAGPSHQSAYGM